jgi:hypothetical protein
MIFLRSEMACIGLGDLGVMYRGGIIGALLGVLGLIPCFFWYCLHSVVLVGVCWRDTLLCIGA